jgi:hypothetical protein
MDDVQKLNVCNGIHVRKTSDTSTLFYMPDGWLGVRT